jgi:hypothetical protein
MKNLFPGYYTPSEEEFRQLWRECVFAFDASMLLNIYRYKPETQEQFFLILERLKDRIWLPYQAATEFYENREVAIAYQFKVYDEISDLFTKHYAELEDELTKYDKRHTAIKASSLLEAIQSGIKIARESLENDRRAHPDLSSSDPLRDRLLDLFVGRVGDPFDTNRLSQIYADAEQRFNLKQPPGYSDAKNKSVPERYGDVVVWYQLIEYAKAERKPVIFVTDDRKEDWWVKKGRKIIGPRPELANELQREAGVSFYMYLSENFLKYAQEFLDVEEQRAAVQEVAEVGRQDEAYQRAVRHAPALSHINLMAFENARLFDNSSIRRAIEAAREFNDPLVRQAIENARSFDQLLVHQAIERARAYDNPLLRHVLDNSKWLDNPATRWAIESATSREHSRIQQLIDATKPFDSPNVRRMIEDARSLDNPMTRQALEAHRLLQRSHLSGQTFSREIHADISPKRLSDLQGSESPENVKVEILLNTAPDESPEDEAVEGIDDTDERSEAPPFELNESPLTITLTYNSDTPHAYKLSHRLRRPAFAEWEEWSLKIESTRRYLSPAELAEHNANKDEDEEEWTEGWQPFYSEWEADEHFYNKLILGITGAKLDEDDEFPADEFREFAPEIIEKLRTGIKIGVITRLYECYCGLERTVSPESNEQRVHQRIDRNSSSFNITHTLLKPTEDESYTFRTNIVRGYFSTNEDGQEVIELKLNLSAAVEFYDRLILNIENATVGGQAFSSETRRAFLEAINPVYKLRVLEPLFDVNAWYFKIDDLTYP